MTSAADVGKRAWAGDLVPVAWFVVGSLAIAAGVAALSSRLGASAAFVLAFGPAVVALVVAWRSERGGIRRLFAETVRRPPRRIWYFSLLIPLVATIGVVPIAAILGANGSPPRSDLALAFVVVPLVVLIPAFAEEFAWRGFAVHHLVARMSPVTAGLVISIPWAVMHLPLFLAGQPDAGLAVWPQVVGVVSLSVLLAWVYVGTGGSILMAALFHATFNGLTPLMSTVRPESAWALRAVLTAISAIVVVGVAAMLRDRKGRAAQVPEPAVGTPHAS